MSWICIFGMIPMIFIMLHCAISKEVSEVTASPNVNILEFEPSNPHPIFEGDYELINVTYNGTTENGKINSIFLKPVLIEDYHLERVRMIANTTMQFKLVNGDWECQNNCSIEVYGVFLGEAVIKFTQCVDKSCTEIEDFKPILDEYHVYISRKPRTLDTVFTVVIVIFGCVVNLGMGCKIDLEVVKQTLKRPVAPAVGFCCQFLFMPLLAFGFTKAIALSATESVGLFANGCSPGGGASNMWTLLLGGDVSLSVTMTAVSTFASLGMFPFWMYTLGRFIIGRSFRIAFENIILSLIGIVVPSIIGIIIQLYRPKVAKIIEKMLKPLMLIILIFMFTVGIWINLFMFKLFTPKLLIAGACLPWSGFLSGFLVSLATRRKKSHIIAITLETGIQNAGVAIMTLRLSLPQPQNDLSIVGAVCPSLFTGMPLILLYIVFSIYHRCKKTKNVELEKRADPTDECPETPASTRSTVFLTTPVTRRKSMP